MNCGLYLIWLTCRCQRSLAPTFLLFHVVPQSLPSSQSPTRILPKASLPSRLSVCRYVPSERPGSARRKCTGNSPDLYRPALREKLPAQASLSPVGQVHSIWKILKKFFSHSRVKKFGFQFQISKIKFYSFHVFDLLDLLFFFRSILTVFT